MYHGFPIHTAEGILVMNTAAINIHVWFYVTFKIFILAWWYHSLTEHLPSMFKDLGLILKVTHTPSHLALSSEIMAVILNLQHPTWHFLWLE